jgi:hypothetical protein
VAPDSTSRHILARDLSIFSPDTASPRAQWANWAAWTAWAALFLTISILIIAGSDHSVVSTYRDATIQWFAGGDIYTDTGHGFLYLPIAAILFAPFAWLPTAACEIAWRFVAIGGFAIGVRRLGRLLERGESDSTFAVLTLAALPPALACARNGQSTLIMAGLMMLACVNLAERRSGWAVLWATLAVALKPLAIVMLLLAPFMDRRLIGRVAIGLVIVLCLPFLTQRPSYVLDQYLKCGQMFRASSHCGMIELWAQPFSVLGLLGVNIPESAQTVMRVIAAGGRNRAHVGCTAAIGPAALRGIPVGDFFALHPAVQSAHRKQYLRALGAGDRTLAGRGPRFQTPGPRRGHFFVDLVGFDGGRRSAGAVLRSGRRAHLDDALRGNAVLAVPGPSALLPQGSAAHCAAC